MAAQLRTNSLPDTQASGAVSSPLNGPKAGDEAQQYYAAIETLERALHVNPNDVDAIVRLGRYCAETNRCVEASALFTQALQVNATHAATFVAMADLLKQQGMYADAIDLLQNAIERNPGEPEFWRAMANIMVALADEDRAVVFFDEALRLNPDMHVARLERAALRYDLGQFDAALADYQLLRTVAPGDPGVLAGWGDVKALMGQRDEARIAYTAALARVGNRQPIDDRLARLAIMEFKRPLPRHDLPASFPSPGARSARVNIVFFHADSPSANLSPFDKPDYHAMLARSIAVARAKTPSAKIVLLSDEQTRFSPELRVDAIRRNPLILSDLMYERMRMELEFLASSDCDGDTVFLDSDVIVNRDPADIFDGTFDVGLTWRSDPPDAPFNGGVAFYRKTPAALKFYRHLIETHHALESFPAVIARFPEGMRRWWGHQLAMAATVGWDEFARRRSDRLAIDDTVVRFLPEREYNFAAIPAVSYNLDRRYFIHFKGARKSAHAPFASQFLGTAALPAAPAIFTAKSASIQKQPVDPGFTTYDLGVAPISYDVTWFLALAHNRGVKHIDIVPGEHNGFRDDGWYQKADLAEKHFRMWNIVVPACQLAGMTVAVHRDRMKAAATVYKMRPIVEEGITEDVFHASAHSKRWVAQWLKARGLERPVVINLRESHWPTRNSNMDAWRHFAAETNAVVIPDTEGSTSFGHAFDAINMDRRLALYEAASVVMGVGNGPLSLCWLSLSISYLSFKMESDYPASTREGYLRQGFPVGSQFKWAGAHQRLVWADDTDIEIQRAYEQFLSTTRRQGSHFNTR